MVEGGPAGGVDVVEIGLPYSDPLMDGPVIQQAVRRRSTPACGIDDVLATVDGRSPPRVADRRHDLLEPGRAATASSASPRTWQRAEPPA